jgi:hypothetical protein
MAPLASRGLPDTFVIVGAAAVMANLFRLCVDLCALVE